MLSAKPKGDLHADQQRACRDERAADRTLQEHGQVAVRQQQRPAEILLHQWAQHEAEQDGSDGEIQGRKDGPGDAEPQDFPNLK